MPHKIELLVALIGLAGALAGNKCEGWIPIVRDPSLTVALWQTHSIVGNKKANLEKLAETARVAASAHHANLIAVPGWLLKIFF